MQTTPLTPIPDVGPMPRGSVKPITPISSLSSLTSHAKSTFTRGTEGGLKHDISWPGYLHDDSGSPGNPSGVTRNDFPDFTNQPLVSPLRMAAITGNPQLLYEEGDYIFTYKPRRDIGSDSYACYAIWNLNYALELSHVKRMQRNDPVVLARGRQPAGSIGPQEYKRKTGNMEKIEDWPTTVEEFARDMLPLGVFNTSSVKPNVRKRVTSIAYKGHVTMPNIFPPNKKGLCVSVGDTVGLVVKAFSNPYRGRINLDGKVEATPTPGPFLQVRGYWEYDCHNPIHCTELGKPSEYDVDFISDVKIDQEVYDYDPETKLLRFDKPIPTKDACIVSGMYQAGYYIQLGTVVRRTKDPSPHDIEMALRSKNGWNALQKYSTVDIELNPHPFNAMV